MRVFLIVGACGSGKTWVLKQLIKEFGLNTLGKVGMFYFHRNEKIIALGKYDGSTFEGSDKLSMAIMKDVEVFKKHITKENKIVVCEGDRFTNQTFLKAMRPNLTIITIVDDGSKGRKKRKSNQTERQIKAVQTRVNNFLKESKHQVVNSDVAYKILKDELKAA